MKLGPEDEGGNLYVKGQYTMLSLSLRNSLKDTVSQISKLCNCDITFKLTELRKM